MLEPGTRLGTYRVEAFLARGSSGEVYRATDERLGRSAAVKVLPPWLSEDPRARDRFLAEARAAASLDHPNVLPVYDAGDEDGTLWIAMRLAEGRDLRELLRREGPLAPERAVALLAGIAAALDAAHARGILHRDVKPGNILLGADASGDHAYLADFGLATAAHGRGLTRTGEILGTVDYVSPEQARGETLDARSDVYSLAAVLFECVAGVAPFHRETDLASLTALLEGSAPPLSTVRPDLPAGLDPVLARGLARDPAERYPSAGALVAAAGTATHGARLRGLLFADLRGYTAFAEREGDVRAAALLARYRDLVRAAVARTGGAEVRTEGDSFYVVFASATAAIRAGLAIVAAADAATRQDPSLPVRPGVGVHAGEPLEAPEGPIGAAVNTAARLCSRAGPGEVLVSATARDLARGSRDVAFASRGRLPAKGLAEPLEAWAASPVEPAASGGSAAAAAVPARVADHRRGLLVAGSVGALLLAVVGIAVLAGSPGASSRGLAGGSPGASPAPTSEAGVLGPSASSGPGTASSAPSGSQSAPAVSPTVGPFPTAAEGAILAALPADVARDCVRGATPEDARRAGWVGRVPTNVAGDPPVPGGFVDILPPRPEAGVTCRLPAGVRLSVQEHRPANSGGSSYSVPDEEVGFMAARWKVPDGDCATARAALQQWTSARGLGTVVCFRIHPYDGRPWIDFSFANGRYLAFATRDDSDYGALYSWWEQLRALLP